MDKKTPDYKSLNKELEEILEQLQSSALDIDRVLVEYERGIDVIDKLEEYLKKADNKVNKVVASKTKTKK